MEPRDRIPYQGEQHQPRHKRRRPCSAMSICATVKAAWYDEAVGRKRGDARRREKLCGELKLELIHIQKAQKLMLRAEVYARALLASQKVER